MYGTEPSDCIVGRSSRKRFINRVRCIREQPGVLLNLSIDGNIAYCSFFANCGLSFPFQLFKTVRSALMQQFRAYAKKLSPARIFAEQ